LPYIFFAHTKSSQAKGVESLGRFLERTEDRDVPSSLDSRDAQYDAVLEWGIPRPFGSAAAHRIPAPR
jgi:hypothetical protein